MSEKKNEKWLVNQLMDFFETHEQVKNLQPAVLGKTKTGILRLTKSFKFTPSIKMILLAIVKYRNCHMSRKTLGNFASLSKTNTLNNLKILEQNKIISITNRVTEDGDSDTNLYFLDQSHLYSYFAKRVVSQRYHHPVDNFNEVVSQQPQGGIVKIPRVVSQRDPIKQIGFNKENKSFYKADQKQNNKLKPEWAAMKNEAESIRQNEPFKHAKTPDELKNSIRFNKPNYGSDNSHNIHAMKVAAKKLGKDLNYL